ncbi:MAG: hypothetical protein GXX10_12060 [Clostridiaceae bacterium]|nr:hypothetical protein [Clostridiaceae bacterium]
MHTIGLDIGTTTICGVLVDGRTGEVKKKLTLPNTSAIPSQKPYERLQDPNTILMLCKKILNTLLDESTDVSAIGITGQMHGILYIDSKGAPLSPLYSWQDGRGNLEIEPGVTYSQMLSRITGYPMATGFGLTTHFYNIKNGLVPSGADKICTIGDFVAMSLTENSTPILHSSNGASIGMFNLQYHSFDEYALLEAGIAPDIVPKVTKELLPLGKTKDGKIVSTAIGDNQASFLGSVSDDESILVNVGTSSQISVAIGQKIDSCGVETRPLLEDSMIAVGCPLCGGDAYALLKSFFEKVALMLRTEAKDLYSKMDREAEAAYYDENQLIVDTRFMGTRHDPFLRGSIANIGTNNFTPGHLALGVLKGICEELYQLYTSMSLPERKYKKLVGSGNGIRKSPLLQEIFSKRFNMDLCIPLYEEEASYGMALMALCLSCGIRAHEARKLIKYKEES